MKAHELSPFLSPNRFHATARLCGHLFQLEIDSPDLRDLPRSMWGDWGPMYTFAPEAGCAFGLSYRCRSLALEGDEEIEVSKIELNSPMLFERREQNPFYLELHDERHGLSFRGYLDASGRPAGLELKLVRPEHEILASLLPDAGSVRFGSAADGGEEARECA